MNNNKTSFISSGLERKVLSLANSLGFSATPSADKSPRHKEIELYIGLGSRAENIYISRTVGISKGQLQIVISPKLYKNLKSELLAVEGVEPAVNRQTKQQVLQSSNYLRFQNKGDQNRGEHWGFGYRVSANDGLLTLSSFLKAIKSSQR